MIDHHHGPHGPYRSNLGGERIEMDSWIGMVFRAIIRMLPITGVIVGANGLLYWGLCIWRSAPGVFEFKFDLTIVIVQMFLNMFILGLIQTGRK